MKNFENIKKKLRRTCNNLKSSKIVFKILNSKPLLIYVFSIRVATAQGKQGIWLLTFPDRENTGNLVNLIFYTGKIVPTRKI